SVGRDMKRTAERLTALMIPRLKEPGICTRTSAGCTRKSQRRGALASRQRVLNPVPARNVSRQAAKASGTLFKTGAKSYVPLNPIPKWPGTLRAADGCAMRAILPGPRVIPVPPCPRTALRLDRDFYLRFLGGVLASR